MTEITSNSSNNPSNLPQNPGAEKSPGIFSRGNFIKALAASLAGVLAFPEQSKAGGLFDPVPVTPAKPTETVLKKDVKKFSDTLINPKGPDFLSAPETEITFNDNLDRLENSIATVLPDYVSKPRILFKQRGPDYYIYSSTGKIPDKGFLPTIKAFSPRLDKNSLDYMGLRIAEELALLVNELNTGEPAKMMVKFYQENLGRNFAQDYNDIAPALNINKFADTAGINEAGRLKVNKDLAAKVYAEGFSRLWMNPDEFMRLISNLPSTASKIEASNLALAIIWSTINCASLPTTTSSLGIKESLVNKLIGVSGKKDEWQKFFKK